MQCAIFLFLVFKIELTVYKNVYFLIGNYFTMIIFHF